MKIRGLSNPAIVSLALLASFLVGGLLWALVGHRLLAVEERGHGTPTPTPTAASTPPPSPSPSPAAPAPPPEKLVGRWLEATDPELVLVLELEGQGLKIVAPVGLAGTFKRAGKRYDDGNRHLELTDAGELVLTTEGKGGDWETRLFARASETPGATPEPPTPTSTALDTPAPEASVTPEGTPEASPVESVPEASPAAAEGTPEGDLGRYYELINSDDFQAAYELRSSRSRQSTAFPEFSRIWSNNRSIQMLDATVTSSDETHAQVQIHLRADDFNRTTHKPTITLYEGTVKMVFEDDLWRYDGGEFKATQTP